MIQYTVVRRSEQGIMTFQIPNEKIENRERKQSLYSCK